MSFAKLTNSVLNIIEKNILSILSIIQNIFVNVFNIQQILRNEPELVPEKLLNFQQGLN